MAREAEFVVCDQSIFNYFRGRTYGERLELDISSTAIREKGVVYLLVLSRIKNVGLSKVTFEPGISSLHLRSASVDTISWRFARNAQWNPDARTSAFYVFKEQQWLEPSEVIEDKQLILIPDNNQYFAFLLELQVASKRKEGITRRRHSMWQTVDVILLLPGNRDSFGEPETDKERS